MPATDEFDCRAVLHEDVIHGRVLEMVLSNSRSPAHWDHEREMIAREVERTDPRTLVVDLRGIDSVYGVALLGTLITGCLALQKLGSDRRTRILASGQVAETLPRILRICKMDTLLDANMYPDLATALKAGIGSQG